MDKQRLAEDLLIQARLFTLTSIDVIKKIISSLKKHLSKKFVSLYLSLLLLPRPSFLIRIEQDDWTRTNDAEHLSRVRTKCRSASFLDELLVSSLSKSVCKHRSNEDRSLAIDSELRSQHSSPMVDVCRPVSINWKDHSVDSLVEVRTFFARFVRRSLSSNRWAEHAYSLDDDFSPSLVLAVWITLLNRWAICPQQSPKRSETRQRLDEVKRSDLRSAASIF